MISTLLTAALIIALNLQTFSFDWEPSSGSVVGYEVEFSTKELFTNQEFNLNRSIVIENVFSITPELGIFYSNIRVRGLGGIPISGDIIDCPFTLCSEWSIPAVDELTNLNSPSLNGDNIVDAKDFIIFSRLYGRTIEDALIIIGE